MPLTKQLYGNTDWDIGFIVHSEYQILYVDVYLDGNFLATFTGVGDGVRMTVVDPEDSEDLEDTIKLEYQLKQRMLSWTQRELNSETTLAAGEDEQAAYVTPDIIPHPRDPDNPMSYKIPMHTRVQLSAVSTNDSQQYVECTISDINASQVFSGKGIDQLMLLENNDNYFELGPVGYPRLLHILFTHQPQTQSLQTSSVRPWFITGGKKINLLTAPSDAATTPVKDATEQAAGAQNPGIGGGQGSSGIVNDMCRCNTLGGGNGGGRGRGNHGGRRTPDCLGGYTGSGCFCVGTGCRCSSSSDCNPPSPTQDKPSSGSVFRLVIYDVEGSN